MPYQSSLAYLLGGQGQGGQMPQYGTPLAGQLQGHNFQMPMGSGRPQFTPNMQNSLLGMGSGQAIDGKPQAPALSGEAGDKQFQMGQMKEPMQQQAEMPQQMGPQQDKFEAAAREAANNPQFMHYLRSFFAG